MNPLIDFLITILSSMVGVFLAIRFCEWWTKRYGRKGSDEFRRAEEEADK